MELGSERLVALREALSAVKEARGRHIPRDVLASLADALPPGVGMTIDFDAAEALGQPLVVLRPCREEQSVFEGLSPREREVAGLVAVGLRNRDIALALGISVGTVKDHVHRVLTKSGLDSRAGIAARWSEP
ncbi:MAG: helix-turn-helix transcriptional regulator [Nannocystales bacterium]